MNAQSVIRTKRDGGVLESAQMRWFLGEYVGGRIPDYQAAALVTAIFLRGMQEQELADWTRAMLETGRTLRSEGSARTRVDKHSTGGIGDKVSIPLAPALAACGLAVPMISGRGLGHTGGTLDKLESIPGFRTRLSEAELERALERHGAVFGAQTEELVPADRLLYRLRDAIGMVESIPLIASSILSKKLAEGLSALVLDVKFGSGAFLPDPQRGAELARAMQALGARSGLRTCVFQTAMDRPLGSSAGHALEIAESIECLHGGGPADLRELVVLFGGELLALAGVAEGARRIACSLEDGSALAVFGAMVEEQGGDPRVLERPERLPQAGARERFAAEREGWLSFRDCRKVGLAVAVLGGGRERIEDAIDPAVGIVWRRRAGERVARGETIAELCHNGRGLDSARALLAQAIEIGEQRELAPLVLARLPG
ncbi:MAG: thymidine phosphorylase [Planctomycetes bacterium]|nr:thymidine phosphorylase [Planctomycetota bacterium]